MIERTKVECEFCKRLISISNISKHIEKHLYKPEAFLKKSYSLNHEGLDCQFCGKTCKNRNSLCNHERVCKLNPERMEIKNLFTTDHQPGQPVWNKGLTKETDERVKQGAEKQKLYYQNHEGSFKNKQHTAESREKISLANAGNTKGNRAKKGYYNGIFCGSTYELVYVIYNLDHNIEFSRCTKHYTYYYKNNKHNYFPDFELSDGTIVEIKGYHTELVDIKTASVTDTHILVLYKKDLKTYFDYVTKNYNVTERSLHSLYQ